MISILQLYQEVQIQSFAEFNNVSISEEHKSRAFANFISRSIMRMVKYRLDIVISVLGCYVELASFLQRWKTLRDVNGHRVRIATHQKF